MVALAAQSIQLASAATPGSRRIATARSAGGGLRRGPSASPPGLHVARKRLKVRGTYDGSYTVRASWSLGGVRPEKDGRMVILWRGRRPGARGRQGPRVRLGLGEPIPFMNRCRGGNRISLMKHDDNNIRQESDYLVEKNSQAPQRNPTAFTYLVSCRGSGNVQQDLGADAEKMTAVVLRRRIGR